MMDHNKHLSNASGAEKPDMQYLTKPRGKGYSLRMAAPEILIGKTNPWTNKLFGREIKLGLKTRIHAEAVRLVDIKVGHVRQLEVQAANEAKQERYGSLIDLSPESAQVWREEIQAAAAPWQVETILHEHLERAKEAGKGRGGRSIFQRDCPQGHTETGHGA